MFALRAREHRLINLIDEVEAEIGQCAFAIAEDTGAMEINPKLIERFRTSRGWRDTVRAPGGPGFEPGLTESESAPSNYQQ